MMRGTVDRSMRAVCREMRRWTAAVRTDGMMGSGVSAAAVRVVCGDCRDGCGQAGRKHPNEQSIHGFLLSPQWQNCHVTGLVPR
jgi:hypothetical protein